MSWSQWHSIIAASNPAPSSQRGVYRVRATDGEGNALAIRRAADTDAEGILYIGQGDLIARIGGLLDTADAGPGSHNFIQNFVHYGFDKIVPRAHLEVQWKVCANPEHEEMDLLEEYITRFCGLPPGNFTSGG